MTKQSLEKSNERTLVSEIAIWAQQWLKVAARHDFISSLKALTKILVEYFMYPYSALWLSEAQFYSDHYGREGAGSGRERSRFNDL